MGNNCIQGSLCYTPYDSSCVACCLKLSFKISIRKALFYLKVSKLGLKFIIMIKFFIILKVFAKFVAFIR